MRWAIFFSMVAAGVALTVQAAVNSRLREAVASPVLSAGISFLIGGAMLWACIAAGFFGGMGSGTSGLRGAPAWSFVGGALGAFYVLATILAVPRIGAGLTISLAVFGQQCAALVLDSTGWLGVPRAPLSATRVAGAILLVLAVVLLQKK